MKIFSKQKFMKDGKLIKKYKFCGITLLRKEKSPTKKKWNLLGVKVCRKKQSNLLYIISNIFDKCKGRSTDLLYIISNIFNKYKGRSTDYILIAKSKYFDGKWYLKQHPDVAKSGMDPVEHYLKYGWKEGRNPSKKFNTKEYLDLNPDVMAANINPLLHYERFGKKEERSVAFTHDIYDLEKIFSRIPENSILLFSHLLTVTGAPIALIKIAEIIKENGYNPIIISKRGGKLEEILRKKNILYYIISNIDFFTEYDLKRYFYKCYFAICNTYEFSAMALKLQKILPTLLYIHEGSEGIRNLWTNTVIIQQNKKITEILKKVENIACVSPYASTFYVPYSKNEIRILRNFVEDPGLKPYYNKDKISFCCIGSVASKRKNIDILLKAFSELCKKYHNIELHMIGDDTSQKAINYKKTYKNIIWHGLLNEKKRNQVMNKCDVCVIPSKSESCSLVALEAAALSKAVIMTHTVGAKYMFTNEKNVLLCDEGKVNSLIVCMEKYINNRHLIEKFGREAYLSYQQNATREITQKELLKIIDEVREKFFRKNQPLQCNDSPKILVHLHLYYQNQWEYFAEKIKNLKRYKYDLFVTIIEDNKDIRKKISTFKSDARVFVVPNKGYDVGPFVILLNQINLDDYDYVIKIHSKNYRKNLYGNNGFSCRGYGWRDGLVDAILQSEQIVARNIDRFKYCSDLGMLGNQKLIGTVPAPMNSEAREKVCKMLKIKNKVYPFIMGTMFMCRANLLNPLKKLNLTWDDFNFSRMTGDSGSIAHAIEDVVAQLVWEQGYTVEGVVVKDNIKVIPKNIKVKRKYVKILGITMQANIIGNKLQVPLLKTSQNGKIYFFKICVGNILETLTSSMSPIKIIETSKFFNPDEYVTMYPNVKESHMTPAEHFLYIGYKLGYNPSYKFNTNDYFENNKDVARKKINPLLHYEKYGKYEGRNLCLNKYQGNREELKIIEKSKFFDAKWYLKTYPEIQLTGLSAAEHYITYGWKEGKNPSEKFSTDEYLKYNNDVKRCGLNPLLHYERYGKKEKRILKYAGPIQYLAYNLLVRGCNKNTQDRNVILIGDLFFEKDIAPIDNFAFFEYIMSLKDSKFEAYYILNKHYFLYDKIKKQYGKHIIPFDNKYSPWFYLTIARLCSKIRYVLDSFDAFSLIFNSLFYKAKYIDIIFTQHGITFFKQEYIQKNVYGAEKLNLTTISNDFEKEIFTKRGGFKNRQLIKLGLFRWDKVKDISKNMAEKCIFVYFTYRHYLLQIDDISTTTYIQKIKSLLNNRDLKDFMLQHNIKFKIALHHGLLRYIDNLLMDNCEIISEDDIGSMKNKASMLITDYSSMCFDFMLQNKPVIFYHLDEEDFLASALDNKYSENINSLNKYIFNVYNTENEVISTVQKYIKNSFILEKANKIKSDKFFYNKSNICEKFYNYLLKHEDK